MSALFAPLIVMIYLVALLFTLKTSFSYAVSNEEKKGFDAIFSEHCILRNIMSMLPTSGILNVVKLKKSPKSINCAISACSDIPLIIKEKKISNDYFSSKNNHYGCYSQIKKLEIVNSTFNPKMLEQIPDTLTELSIDGIEYPLGTNAREFNEKFIDTIVKKFKNLEKLDLRNCGITITPKMIEAISTMPKLTHLGLSRNLIHLDAVNKFDELKNINSLDLSYSKINNEKVMKISKMGNIAFLNLSGNELSGETAHEIFKMSNLVSLDLSNNDINYLKNEALSEMKNLTHLNLARNDIYFFSDQYTSKKSSLTHLNLSSNRINADSISRLSLLKSITDLDLSRNHIIDKEVVLISEMKNLTHLKLSQNEIRDKGACALSGMSNLIQLDLSDNKIGDDGASAISKMKNLTHLNISKNRIGNKGAHALSQRSPSWRYLNLSSNWSGSMYALMKYFSFLFDCIEYINY